MLEPVLWLHGIDHIDQLICCLGSIRCAKIQSVVCENRNWGEQVFF